MKRIVVLRPVSLLLTLSMLTGLFYACNEDGLNESNFVAGDAFTNSSVRVIRIDTFWVHTSSMKFDSIITSQSDRMLVGKYLDPFFGTVQCGNFMELTASGYTIGSEAEFDSIALYLKPDKYYYNDTLQFNTIHVKQLNEKLKPDSGDHYYNTSSVSFDPDDLGFLSYTPRPFQADSLQIRLRDSFGEVLFERLQNKTITDSNEFREYLHGIAVLPGESDNGAIMGFSLASGASYMRLHFSTFEETERVAGHIDFHINTTSTPIPFFNQITAEAPHEYIQLLKGKEFNLSSSESGNQSFIQSGIGVATRIQFPSIKSIHDIQGNGTILNATLKIKPTAQTFNDQLILRDSLSIFVVNQNNDITEQLLLADVSPARAILNREDQEFGNVYYEVPLGSYLDKLLNAERDTDEALILFPDNYNDRVDRFILNGNDNTDYPATLELTYSIYDEDE